MSHRIKKVFSDNRKKLITFVTGGDPDFNTSNKIIENLVKNGADIIEIGMPFSDPMADGPVIQKGVERSLAQKTSFKDILNVVKKFRKKNAFLSL